MTSNELEIFKQSILDDIRVMMQTTGQVTQYIGARYVPLFADPIEWDDQREYEPLTVVLHQGNSYTTRQFTPKGIDISNETFWAETGNYNAQIEQYRQEVAAFNERISAVESALETKAPINHATDSTEYGVGNSVNYGHVKLADVGVSMSSGANEGIAATPKMVYSISNLKSAHDYGAVGNGIDDDSDAVQNFVNMCASQKSIAFFPNGDYLISKTINVPEGSYIIGQSAQFTQFIVKSDIVALSIYKGATQAEQNNGVKLENFGISGYKSWKEDYNSNDFKKSIGIYVLGNQYIFNDIHIEKMGVGILSETTSDYGVIAPPYQRELQRMTNISVTHCLYGIMNCSTDNQLSNITIGRCYIGYIETNMVKLYSEKHGGGNHINNIHVWGFGINGVQCQSSFFNNIYVESPISYPDKKTGSYIQCYGSSQFNNVYIYNIHSNAEENYEFSSIFGVNISTMVIVDNLILKHPATPNVDKEVPSICYMANSPDANKPGILTIKNGVISGEFNKMPKDPSIGNNTLIIELIPQNKNFVDESDNKICSLISGNTTFKKLSYA